MHIKPLHILLVALLLLGACNDIAPSDRLIEVPATTAKRKVLVEEFTGQRCLNCPAAAEELSRLQAQYGADTLVVVAIHGGRLAIMPKEGLVGLATPLGNSYAEHWGYANSVPKVLVNRQRAGSVKEGVEGKLQLWLVEDGIVALQQFPDNVVKRDYVHNHVLRAALNGDWGEPISLPANAEKTLTHKLTLPEGIKAGNAWVVAFVYNDAGVVQVERRKVGI